MFTDSRFEKFTGSPAGPRKNPQPHITIGRSGLIYLNAAAYKELGRPGYVTLYYSGEDDAIAVEPTFPPTPESFPVTKKQHGWAIHTSAFCRRFRIRVSGTQVFLRPEFKPGILILNLRETDSISIRDPA